jgi:hypothetical protein
MTPLGFHKKREKNASHLWVGYVNNVMRLRVIYKGAAKFTVEAASLNSASCPTTTEFSYLASCKKR